MFVTGVWKVSWKGTDVAVKVMRGSATEGDCDLSKLSHEVGSLTRAASDTAHAVSCAAQSGLQANFKHSQAIFKIQVQQSGRLRLE
jgi:hypothetical protein